MDLEYRDMTMADLDRLREIDRSEHVTTAYAMAGGTLASRAVDWNDPGWHDGDGEHSFDHQIEFSRRHLAAGARALGCFTADDRLVGFGLMTPEVEPGVAQLSFLYVSRAYRRRGIARELLDRLSHWAQAAGAAELYVSAAPSESAVSFYQAAGFRVTDRPNPDLLSLEPQDIHLRQPL
jgi:ribosomal protein S18 acetylase RimI-like enzyme